MSLNNVNETEMLTGIWPAGLYIITMQTLEISTPQYTAYLLGLFFMSSYMKHKWECVRHSSLCFVTEPHSCLIPYKLA